MDYSVDAIVRCNAAPSVTAIIVTPLNKDGYIGIVYLDGRFAYRKAQNWTIVDKFNPASYETL